jgi:hypothetical protein
MRKGLIFVSILATASAGCATKPPQAGQLRTPTADRLIGLQAHTDGDASVVVTRDIGYSGSGCYAAVFVDGVVVGKLGTGERASFYMPAGEHVLGTWNTGSGLCGYREGQDRRETSVMLKPGDVKRYRILINQSGVEIAPTTLD